MESKYEKTLEIISIYNDKRDILDYLEWIFEEFDFKKEIWFGGKYYYKQELILIINNLKTYGYDKNTYIMLVREEKISFILG